MNEHFRKHIIDSEFPRNAGKHGEKELISNSHFEQTMGETLICLRAEFLPPPAEPEAP